jgi:hypothetical protein
MTGSACIINFCHKLAQIGTATGATRRGGAGFGVSIAGEEVVTTGLAKVTLGEIEALYA